ncbi:MAG: hypothetical protein ACTS8S_03640 [Giesbergeria sp.]
MAGEKKTKKIAAPRSKKDQVKKAKAPPMGMRISPKLRAALEAVRERLIADHLRSRPAGVMRSLDVEELQEKGWEQKVCLICALKVAEDMPK